MCQGNSLATSTLWKNRHRCTMDMTILATKLYIPALRPRAVSRPRLFERLDVGVQRQLILVSAPAGFGKTTLISKWLAGGQRPAAWLSLDAADNDPARFLTYFIGALRTVAGTLGEDVLAMLQAPQHLSPEELLTPLLNEVARIPTPFVCVFDDYHSITNETIQQILAYLLDHLPPRCIWLFLPARNRRCPWRDCAPEIS